MRRPGHVRDIDRFRAAARTFIKFCYRKDRMSDTPTSEAPPRKRSMTSMTLNWIADKFRRAEEIKRQISDGSYSVDSRKVAAAIANEEDPAQSPRCP